MVIKITTTLVVLVISAMSAILNIHIPLIICPLILYFLFRIWTSRKTSLDELKNLKYSPWNDRSADRLSLDGDWEVKWRGIDWHPIKIPSDLAAVSFMSANSKKLMFKREFGLLQQMHGKKIILCGRGFGGVGRFSLDGKDISGDVYGYLPYEIELPSSMLDKEKHELSVELNDAGRNLEPGSEKGLAPSFGVGLFREIFLEYRDDIYFSNVRFSRCDSASELGLVIEIHGKGSEFPVAVSVRIESEKSKKCVFDGMQIISGFKESTQVIFNLEKEAIKHWSPEEAELYNISVQAVCDELRVMSTFQTGYSACTIRNGHIWRGDEKVVLRGVKRSEHFPPYGAAVPKWAGKKDIQALKETGLNVVYSENYPPHPDFMVECDRSGLFCISEFPFGHEKRLIGKSEAIKLLIDCTKTFLLHPSFLYWIIRDVGNRDDVNEIKAALKEISIENVAVFSTSSREKRRSGGAIEYEAELLDVDLYRIDLLQSAVKICSDCGAGLIAMEYVDSAGGSEDRRTREMRKAAADLILLKAADAMDCGALILGRLFTWGIRQGVFSINRSKKASADNIREYLRTKKVVEPDFSEFPVRLYLRFIPLIAIFSVFAWITVPVTRELFISIPTTYSCFHSNMHFLAIGIGMLPVAVLSIPLLFEWKRGWLPGIATSLGYPNFYNLYNRHWLRVIITLLAYSYFFYLGALSVSFLSGLPFEMVLKPLINASVFEVVFIVFLFAPIDPIIVFISAGLLGGIYLCWFINPMNAFLFEAIFRLPFILGVAIMQTKDIFRNQMKKAESV